MKSVKELVAEGNSHVNTLSAEEAFALLEDANTAFIDLRDDSEVAPEGTIPGSVHVTRGMLEFALDPAVPYHNPVFSSEKNFLFYCASGGRSALAADTAQRLGLPRVCHLAGGFKAGKRLTIQFKRCVKSPVPVDLTARGAPAHFRMSATFLSRSG